LDYESKGLVMAKKQRARTDRPKVKTDTKVRKNFEKMDRRLGAAISDAQAELKAAIKELERNIIDSMAGLRLDIKGGPITTSVGLRRAQKMHEQLVAQFEEYYGRGSRRAIAGYNSIVKDIQKYWPTKKAIKYTKFDKALIDALAKQTLAEYAQFGNYARERIARAMYSNVLAKGKFSSFVQEIQAVLGTGTDVRGNSLAQYADLWANDGIMNFYQSVELRKAKEQGITSFLFDGDPLIIETSRDFCIERAGKIFTIDEIESWNDLDWKGKRGPALIYRGGWNCRHSWIPIENPEEYEAQNEEG
jgi:hypothetical protein